MKDPPIKVRNANCRDDVVFIENAWRGTLLHLAPACLGADPGHLHGELQRVFDRLLPHAVIRIAHDPLDDQNKVGFAVATGPELHYCYVNADFRRIGLVPKMLEGLTIRRYTFITLPGQRRLKPKERGWLFTPRFTI